MVIEVEEDVGVGEDPGDQGGGEGGWCHGSVDGKIFEEKGLKSGGSVDGVIVEIVVIVAADQLAHLGIGEDDLDIFGEVDGFQFPGSGARRSCGAGINAIVRVDVSVKGDLESRVSGGDGKGVDGVVEIDIGKAEFAQLEDLCEDEGIGRLGEIGPKGCVLIKEVDQVGIGIDDIKDMDIGIVGGSRIDLVVIIVLRDRVVDKSDQALILKAVVVVVGALDPFIGNILFKVNIDIKSGRNVRLVEDGGEIPVVGNEGLEGGEVREEGIVID